MRKDTQRLDRVGKVEPIKTQKEAPTAYHIFVTLSCLSEFSLTTKMSASKASQARVTSKESLLSEEVAKDVLAF